MSDVFNRYEKKYKLTLNQYQSIISAIKLNMTDSYTLHLNKRSIYTVKNIYYDTDDYLLIKRSLSKPIYKEKLRLRGYGSLTDDSLVFLEIKKKYKKFVNKRRTTIKLSDANEFIRTGRKPEHQSYHNGQVMKEIEYFLSQNSLLPKVYIQYDRLAFEENGLRITFDNNLLSSHDSLSLNNSIGTTRLLENDIYLMEIKTTEAMPMWLTNALSTASIFPNSFSKYGTDFMLLQPNLNNQKGDTIAC